jgi:hypothetical protein
VDGNVAGGATLTPAQLGFTDPNSCGLAALNWTGACGTAPGATMTCAFGANAVTVSASNNGFAYSDAHDITVTVSTFSSAVSPAAATLAAGKSATFLVTLTPQVAPFRTPITLTCDSTTLPPQTACSFNPPTVTLGLAAARSTMTLTTTAPAASATPNRRRKAGLWWLPGDLTRMRPSPALVLWPFAALLILSAMRRQQFTRRATAAAIASLTVAAVLGQAIFGSVPASADAGLALFPTTLTFGPQVVGTTAPAQLVYLTNVGADPLTLASISMTGPFAETDTCAAGPSGSLNAGASCTINVTFSPTISSTAAVTGSMTIVDGAAGSPHTVSLSGTGSDVPLSGTPAGIYSVGVGGTSGLLTNTAVLTLTVQ